LNTCTYSSVTKSNKLVVLSTNYVNLFLRFDGQSDDYMFPPLGSLKIHSISLKTSNEGANKPEVLAETVVEVVKVVDG